MRTGPSNTRRTGDWERTLAAYLEECEARPHAYGQHDCLLFAAGAEFAMTGHDPAAEIRGRYRSQAGAVRVLRERGYASLVEAIDAHKREVPIGFARRGDWALHDGSVGVVAGKVALFVGALRQAQDGREQEIPGLVRVPRAEWQKAWRVG